MMRGAGIHPAVQFIYFKRKTAANRSCAAAGFRSRHGNFLENPHWREKEGKVATSNDDLQQMLSRGALPSLSA
jgi:hypothetical protein